MSSGSDGPHDPDLSVVVVAPNRYENIRKTIRHLRGQTVRERLEIIMVMPSADGLGVDADAFEDFLRVRVVEAGTIGSIAGAVATGIRQASAPVVALVEDHAYPDAGWAEALIGAHRQPWAAVGPAIGNANPGSMISWASLFFSYGRWVEPAASGTVDDLPGHNSSYKRTVLLDYGLELEAMLTREGSLHRDLQAKGYRLCLERAAKIYHLNVSLPSSYVLLRFHAARMYASTRVRSEAWSPLRRLVYIGGGPIIPLVYLCRMLREIRRSGHWAQLLPRILPVLILGSVVSAAGEMVGYAFGSGDARQQLSHFDFHRLRHVTAQDRQAEDA